MHDSLRSAHFKFINDLNLRISLDIFSHNQAHCERKPSFLLLRFSASRVLARNPRIWGFSSSRSSGWCWPSTQLPSRSTIGHHGFLFFVSWAPVCERTIFLSAWPRRDWSSVFRTQIWGKNELFSHVTLWGAGYILGRTILHSTAGSGSLNKQLPSSHAKDVWVLNFLFTQIQMFIVYNCGSQTYFLYTNHWNWQTLALLHIPNSLATHLYLP